MPSSDFFSLHLRQHGIHCVVIHFVQIVTVSLGSSCLWKGAVCRGTSCGSANPRHNRQKAVSLMTLWALSAVVSNFKPRH